MGIPKNQQPPSKPWLLLLPSVFLKSNLLNPLHSASLHPPLHLTPAGNFIRTIQRPLEALEENLSIPQRN